MPTEQNPNLEVPQNTGVINPYALAELVAGRRINWKTIENRPQLLEDILQTPYDELFDPKFQSPLYFGLELNEKLELQPKRSPLLDLQLDLDANDLEDPTPIEFEKISKLADLAPKLKVEDIGQLKVKRAASVNKRNLQLTLEMDDRDRLRELARIFPNSLIQTVAPDPESGGKQKEWTPDNATWGDPGRFFNEAAEGLDPQQGAVANCYYIAALSAVAWAMPYKIQHMTRATGIAQQAFTNLIRFYKPDSDGKLDREIEVTDAVPLRSGSGNYLYARSTEAGEIWPAVYEKAYAKLLTGTESDRPNILETAWGSSLTATAQLTGGQRFGYGTSSRSADEIWNLVRGNSRGGRTFNPMTCWTYSTGAAANKNLNYSDANIVASHAYTIMGWAYRSGRKYIVVRNPWGYHEATDGVLSGQVSLFDISFWRPIQLTDSDGVFAIEASAFKTYFRGLGVVK